MKKIIFSLLFFAFVFSLCAKSSDPKIGVWSKYKVKSDDGYITYQIGITGKEKNAFWYETVLYTKEDGKPTKTIMSMLIAKDEKGNDKVQRFIMQSGNEPAKEFPASLFHGMGEQQKAYFDHLEELGNEQVKDKNIVVTTKKGVVKTPAGTFKVKIITAVNKKKKIKSVSYISQSIEPTKLVKYVENGVTQVELLAYGKNGKSQIKGKIEKLDLGKEMGNMLKGNFGGMFGK